MCEETIFYSGSINDNIGKIRRNERMDKRTPEIEGKQWHNLGAKWSKPYFSEKQVEFLISAELYYRESGFS